tara:strand:+ start:11055 stop:11639 length:585 start_codon:yes stop_codon:yes gene_type:complete
MTDFDTSGQTRAVALYGEVNEDTASDLISAMLFMNDPIEVEPVEPDPEEPDAVYLARRPFDLYINTPGGSASDMFAIYDVLKKIEKENQVSTYGIGKVMSAGVLILAAGTKGKRHISENCRVMMHSVAGGHVGTIHDIKNEMKEMQIMQDMHIKMMCRETKFEEKQLRKMLKTSGNVYFSAEEAVEWGIADAIM